MVLLFLMGWVALPLSLLSFLLSAYLLQFPLLSPPHRFLYYLFLFLSFLFYPPLLSFTSLFPLLFPLLSSPLLSSPLLSSPPFSSSPLLSPTQCDASEATWQLIQAVLNRTDRPQPTRIMFLGGGCAPATEPLAALSGRFYNVSQVIVTMYRIAVTPLDTHLMFKLHFPPTLPLLTTQTRTSAWGKMIPCLW